MAEPKKQNQRSKDNERIKELEKELSTTKYNKRTQHHVGLVKAKLALLKEKQVKKSAGKGKTEGFTVRKAGDATVILVGFPSVGKSTLLNKITNAKSQVGQYAFTTLTCIPGTLHYKHAKIQVLDVPGIIEGAASGRGRGKEVLSVASNSDLVVILVDVFTALTMDKIKREIADAHIRMNQVKPDVTIKKKGHGGISIGTTLKLTKITNETIKGILQEFRIMNADVLIRDDITADELIDVIEGNKHYVPGILVINKVDLATKEQIEEIKKKVKPDLMISANEDINIDKLKELIFDRLRLMRIYCKEVGKKADLDEPLIVFRGCTIKDMCLKLHKDFLDKFKFARIWGPSAKFDGQMLRRKDHELKEGDVVELHMK